MKPSTLILSLVAGALVFLVVLVLYLPASWFASLLPPQAKCREIGGSVWHGECLGLEVQGAKFGDAIWNLSPLEALTGRLSGDVDVRGAGLVARSDVDIGFDGAGELRRLTLNFPLDPALHPQFPRYQRGQISADLQRLVLGANGAPKLIQGTVELRDFRQVGSQPLELGSYQTTFDGQVTADGVINGLIRDLGGPFAVEARLALTPPNAYLVEGLITGRTADAERLVRNAIAVGARPDAAGRSEFSFEGTF